MNRIVLQFAGLWLGASGALCYAQWNGPSFGNTYRVAQADELVPPAPLPEETMRPMDAPRDADSSVLADESGYAGEAGAPMAAGPVGYGPYGYGNGGTFGGDACCEPIDPCATTLWDGYWGARHHWCMKGHGCGHCGHGLLPQLNWAGGCCAHRACFGAGMGGAGCCGHGGLGHKLGGGLFGHGHHGVACCEEPVAECGCEPCGDSCCGHHGFLPQLNWAGGCCAHKACFGAGVVGHGHGHGFLGGHGHRGVGMMNAGCSDCGN